MLRFVNNSASSSRPGRREFLRIGGLGPGGLTLGDMMKLQAAAKRLPK